MRVDLQDILTRPPTPPDWLVPGFLHKDTMVVLAGQPGIGKSFLSMTLSVALATGTMFLERELKPGKVLYFDEENSKPDFEEYFKWVWRGLGKPNPSLLLANLRAERFTLAEAPGPDGHYAAMRRIAEEHQPDLIVLDTTTPACQLKDENDNAMATEAIQKLRAVQRINGSTILLLKHAKVDIENGTHTVRGAKAWVGATDATLIHMGLSGKPRTDGLRDSQVIPEKIRAFGLQGTLKIKPSWINPDTEKGLALSVIV